MEWNKDKDLFALMAGHGTQTNSVFDPGCVYGGYIEAGMMLEATKVAVNWLRKSGIKVITDADTNNDKNIIKCVEWANREGAKLYMSIHCDYKDSKIRGTAPLYVSSAGKAMAVTVGKVVAKEMGLPWEGAFKRTNLYELNATDMPAVILETARITEYKKLSDSKKLGKAIAQGICDYLGVKMFAHTNAWRLRSAAKKITAYMKKHNFKYKASWKDNSLTWAGAKKKKTTNCSTMVSYALQKIGKLEPGEYFWINGNNIVCKGGLTQKKLEKIATILHPNKSPKNFKMKKGDICGYANNAHTQIYEGKTKAGNPKWYSTGGADDIKKGKAHVKSSYNDKKISTIIRLK